MVKLHTDKPILSQFLRVAARLRIDELELPHSDVFYVRAALEERTGETFTLSVVEEAMRKEGWREDADNESGNSG